MEIYIRFLVNWEYDDIVLAFLVMSYKGLEVN